MFLQNWIATLTMSLGQDVQLFLPELILCASIVLLLFLRLFSALNRFHLGSVAFLLTAIALVASMFQWKMHLEPSGMFSSLAGEAGLLAYDHLTVFLRMFL